MTPSIFRHFILAQTVVILLGVVQTQAGNYQFNYQSDTAEEVLFPYQVLDAGRVDVLVKD